SSGSYEALEADSVDDGWRMMADRYPDLAMLELRLPDGDGLDRLDRVRISDRVAGGVDPELPLLVLSGRGSELDRLRGFERGCDDYLVKPFSYQELVARIRALLRRTERRP